MHCLHKLLSYAGSVIAYFLSTHLSALPYVKNPLQTKLQKHINNVEKWGGLFVFISAVSPVPHSIVSLASGLRNRASRAIIMVSFSVYAFYSLRLDHFWNFLALCIK